MKIKKTVLTVALLALVVPIVYTSCKRDSFETVSRPQFSGEEYFTGLVFVKGPVAERIPEYREIQSIVKAIEDDQSNLRVANFTGQLISEINSKKPRYFDEFKREILSKDPIRVDNALLNASNIITEATLIKGITTNTNSVKAKEYVENAIKVNREKFDGLMMDLKNGRIQKKDFEQNLQNIFPDSDIKKLLVSSKSSGDVGPDCLICLVVNVGVLVNLAIAINIGVETNFNIHFNINYHTNINVEVELVSANRLAPALSSERNSLKREKFIASIIKNI